MVSIRIPAHHAFVTGATGLVGAAVVKRMLKRNASVHIHALVRQPSAAAALLTWLGADAARVTTVCGDVTKPGLGIERSVRERLGRSVRTVVHAAADTTFSAPLETARAINAAGTGHVLELAAAWQVERLVHVSTAYVAGARTGCIAELAGPEDTTFVNAYEQSKHEAELLVRRSRVPYVIVRPSSIVCDDARGGVTQYNALHRALRVMHAGYGSIMPGTEDTPVDMVTTAHVAEGIVAAVSAPDAVGGTYHLCAGAGAIPLGELLDTAYDVWSGDVEWRRRGVMRPALTDLSTYRLFERTVEETGDVRLATITRSLSHFVPQLALPKVFDTRCADLLLGHTAAAVRTFWPALATHLVEMRWGAVRSAA